MDIFTKTKYQTLTAQKTVADLMEELTEMTKNAACRDSEVVHITYAINDEMLRAYDHLHNAGEILTMMEPSPPDTEGRA